MRCCLRRRFAATRRRCATIMRRYRHYQAITDMPLLTARQQALMLMRDAHDIRRRVTFD